MTRASSRKRCETSSVKACGSTPAVTRGLLDLLAVLVGAGEEEDLAAVQAHEAGQRVAGERGVGVADMRGVVDVVDRRRDVEGAGRGHPVSRDDQARPGAGSTSGLQMPCAICRSASDGVEIHRLDPLHQGGELVPQGEPAIKRSAGGKGLQALGLAGA